MGAAVAPLSLHLSPNPIRVVVTRTHSFSLVRRAFRNKTLTIYPLKPAHLPQLFLQRKVFSGTVSQADDH